MSTDLAPTSSAGTDLALPDDFTGLEDFNESDMAVPRLTIDHDNAVLVDSLTNEQYGELKCVLLGLVKQRILWDVDVESNDHPLCKSYDFTTGQPDAAAFPWKESGFKRDDFDADAPQLDCGSCALKDWDSHPQRNTPWCAEQYVMPLVMETTDGYAPAIFTVQRSGMKPAKAYITGFARAKTPLYTVVTTVSLDAQKRGSVKFATPKFVKGDATPQESWAEFADQYRRIREFVSAARVAAPPTAASDGKPGGTPAAAPKGDAASDDEIPF